MSEEKVFRPQKRSQEDNQNVLNEMSKIHKMAGNEVNEDFGPVEIKGNVPPEFQQVLANQQQPEQAPPPMPPTMPANSPPNQPGLLDTTENSQYHQLLEKIRANKSVYEPITLPSKGKFYDGQDGPADGVLHIRRMTGQEEEILSTARFVRKGQAMNMILNRCIQESYDSANFLSEDRTYILIYLRGISYSTSYDVEIKCPECERKFQHEIELNNLYVESCPDDFEPNNLKDVLPDTGIPFSYTLFRGYDEQKIQNYRDRKMKFDTGAIADDTLLYRTAMSIEEIGGLTDPEQIKNILKELPINDVSYLRDLVTNPPFGVDTSVDIFCPGCSYDFTIDLPLESNFFFPRGQSRKKKRSTPQLDRED
jgi:hypothetical protein